MSVVVVVVVVVIVVVIVVVVVVVGRSAVSFATTLVSLLVRWFVGSLIVGSLLVKVFVVGSLIRWFDHSFVSWFDHSLV